MSMQSSRANKREELDPPTMFDDLLPTEQQALRLWVRLALEPTKNIGRRFNYSYGLKHDAENALGWYVSNGALKGAVLAEGYRWQECEGTPRNPNPNWVFNSRRRCPHRMVGGLHDWHFNCPAAEQRPHRSADTFPALCQATAEELGEFDRLRVVAGAEREAWRAELRRKEEGKRS